MAMPHIKTAESFDARPQSLGIAILVHELREPLGVMRSAVELLQQSRPDTVCDVLRRQVDHIDRVLTDVLGIWRAGHAGPELMSRRVDLGTLVTKVADAERGVADACGVTLEARAPSEPIVIVGSPVLLSHLVGNLLSNAVRVTPNGGRVSVALERTRQDAIVHVVDSGCGIAAEVMPTLFVPFATPREGHGAGLGLGLSIVKAVAVAHGGDVTAHSLGEGQGAEFIVRLPFRPPSSRPTDWR